MSDKVYNASPWLKFTPRQKFCRNLFSWQEKIFSNRPKRSIWVEVLVISLSDGFCSTNKKKSEKSLPNFSLTPFLSHTHSIPHSHIHTPILAFSLSFIPSFFLTHILTQTRTIHSRYHIKPLQSTNCNQIFSNTF